MASPQIGFIKSPKLLKYIQRIDDFVYSDTYLRSKANAMIDQTLDASVFENEDILIGGIRIYVRYLQGIDYDRQDHQDFYSQNKTPNGVRGQKFVDMVFNSGFKVVENTSNNIDWVQQFLAKNDKYANFTSIVNTVINNLFGGIPDYKSVRAEFFISNMNSIIDIFQEFMTAYEEEYRRLNPTAQQANNSNTIPSSTDPNNSTIPQNPQQEPTTTETNTNDDFIYIILFFLVLILIIVKSKKSKKKPTTKKR